MCEVCRHYPCDNRCPNAPEPPIFAHCEECGYEIYDGDEYFEIDGKHYCQECIDSCWRTAEVDYGR